MFAGPDGPGDDGVFGPGQPTITTVNEDKIKKRIPEFRNFINATDHLKLLII